MKNLLNTLILLFAFTFAHAQSDIKARIEFEEAEKAYEAANYETALNHLAETEKLIGKWTPTVAYLKIEALHAITDMGNFGAPTMQPLYEEVTKYMAHMNKLKSNDIPTEKYKTVYAIEKTLKALKLEERQSPEFLKAKKEHDAKNYDAAIPLYAALANKGNTWAMRNLGLLYNIKEEKEKSYSWYKKAAENNNAEAALDLAGGLDLEGRKKWYEKAAQIGDPGGVAMQGAYADIVDKNPTKAMEYYQQAADLGSGAALTKIGELFYDKKEYEQAFLYLRKAAIKENTKAMRLIGELYFFGNGVEKNTQAGMEWHLKAANRGNTDAMLLIAYTYENGQGGFTKDYKKAEQWYQKAIDAGQRSSYNSLGRLYSLPDNNHPKKALENYEKAAEVGYPSGMLETANLYFSGNAGITKDYTKAAKYYESYYEIKKENKPYLDNLIEIYNRGGHGVEKDKEKAKYWKDIRRK
ncbi:SEL1-like repeat protein [Kaistella sp.]|uniref:SEL1-like repeat protein n=1 Tax=Kaistella sp. TaxID=2782235 RepID=UPI003C5FFDFC